VVRGFRWLAVDAARHPANYRRQPPSIGGSHTSCDFQPYLSLKARCYLALCPRLLALVRQPHFEMWSCLCWLKAAA
jgi:hypothetical protein